MSKLASLVTSLVLGSSGLAAAAPYATPPAAPHVEYQYKRPAPLPASWQSLGSARLGTGYASRSMLDVSSRERFDKIELVANAGKMEIKRVTIKFADGQSQVVRLKSTLEKGCTPLTIDLDGARGRRIDAITVQGTGGWRSSFSVLAI